MNRRLLSLARGPRLPLAVTVLCGLLAGWLTIAQARSLSLVVDGVFLGGQTWQAVRPTLLFLLGLIAGRALLAWLTEVIASAMAAAVKNDLRARLFDKIQSLGPAFVRGERTGELTAAALEGVEALDAYFSQYLPQEYEQVREGNISPQPRALLMAHVTRTLETYRLACEG